MSDKLGPKHPNVLFNKTGLRIKHWSCNILSNSTNCNIEEIQLQFFWQASGITPVAWHKDFNDVAVILQILEQSKIKLLDQGLSSYPVW